MRSSGAWESDPKETGQRDEGSLGRRVGSWRGGRVRGRRGGTARGRRRRRMARTLHRPINIEQQQPAADTTDASRYSIEQQLGQVL